MPVLKEYDGRDKQGGEGLQPQQRSAPEGAEGSIRQPAYHEGQPYLKPEGSSPHELGGSAEDLWDSGSNADKLL